jgi:hypothetical protein
MTDFMPYAGGRIAYDYPSGRKEGTVIDVYNEYGTEMVEVLFDGEEKSVEVTAHYCEGLTDPYEYAAQTIHHGKEDRVPERDWTTREAAETKVQENTESLTRMGHIKTTQSRLVRRRKPGNVEAV